MSEREREREKSLFDPVCVSIYILVFFFYNLLRPVITHGTAAAAAAASASAGREIKVDGLFLLLPSVLFELLARQLYNIQFLARLPTFFFLLLLPFSFFFCCCCYHRRCYINIIKGVCCCCCCEHGNIIIIRRKTKTKQKQLKRWDDDEKNEWGEPLFVYSFSRPSPSPSVYSWDTVQHYKSLSSSSSSKRSWWRCSALCLALVVNVFSGGVVRCVVERKLSGGARMFINRRPKTVGLIISSVLLLFSFFA